jgi:hypothetical protein
MSVAASRNSTLKAPRALWVSIAFAADIIVVAGLSVQVIASGSSPKSNALTGSIATNSIATAKVIVHAARIVASAVIIVAEPGFAVASSKCPLTDTIAVTVVPGFTSPWYPSAVTGEIVTIIVCASLLSAKTRR